MMVSTVVGRFRVWRGTLVYDPTNPTVAKSEVHVELGSVETGDESRDEYLRTSEFFDLRHHPTMDFVSRRVTTRGDDLVVEGDLSIRGTTRAVRLEVTAAAPRVDGGHERVVFDAKGVLRRADFGLRWSRLVEAGGFTVSDDVEVVLHVEATRPR